MPIGILLNLEQLGSKVMASFSAISESLAMAQKVAMVDSYKIAAASLLARALAPAHLKKGGPWSSMLPDST